MLEMRENMKTFEYYCNRVDEGFTRAKGKIEEIQCLDLD